MAHRNDLPLPSHRGLAFNKLRDYLAYAFIIILLIFFIAFWSIRYAISRDCSKPYDRHLKIGKHWVIVRAGSTANGCSQP